MILFLKEQTATRTMPTMMVSIMAKNAVCHVFLYFVP